MEAQWPALLGDGTVNDIAIEAVHHLIKVTHEFRVRLKKMLDMKGKVSNLTWYLCYISKLCFAWFFYFSQKLSRSLPIV